MKSPEPHGLNTQQQKFADFYLGGKTATAAYIKAGYSPNAAPDGASRLLKHPKVAAYIKAERKALSELARWEKWQLLDFHQAVLETPLSEVDETSVLAQEVQTDEIGEEVIRKKIRMVPKMEAAKEFAKLMGWNAPEIVKHEATEELEELIRLTRAGS
jgi:phage terminase small subunit